MEVSSLIIHKIIDNIIHVIYLHLYKQELIRFAVLKIQYQDFSNVPEIFSIH